jgi:predicted nucleic acid-binding protein
VRIAIDTNRYVDFARGLPEAVNRLRAADRILVPVIVLGELRAGFLALAR